MGEQILRQGYLILTYEFHKEKKTWVGICQELGTSTFGRSLPEVEDKLNEAVDLQVETLIDIGEIEQFLKERKIQVIGLKPSKDTKFNISAGESAYTKPHIQPFQDTLIEDLTEQGSDPDEGLILKDGIEQRLIASSKLSRDSLISSDEMKRRLGLSNDRN
jgi:predicted RNase H-like HicB family nuclease